VSHYWSPDSRFICYAELNDTGVPLQAWPWYGLKSVVYARTIYIAYPKVTIGLMRQVVLGTAKPRPARFIDIRQMALPVPRASDLDFGRV